MKRRTFILLSGSTFLASGMAWTGCTDTGSTRKILSTPRFLSAFCPEDEVSHIGATYRKQVTEEDNEGTLEKFLLTDSEGKTISSSAGKASLEAWLDKHIQADFDSGRTVIVQGWVLSATEARQCAMYSLIHS